jgi:hypothetical protein
MAREDFGWLFICGVDNLVTDYGYELVKIWPCQSSVDELSIRIDPE